MGPAQPRQHALDRRRRRTRLGEFSYATGERDHRSPARRRGAAPTSPATRGRPAAARSPPAATASWTQRRAPRWPRSRQRGLGGAIDLANTNTYGGCFGPREVRPAGGTTGGSLSRHSWGQAIDMNTVATAMGCVPEDELHRRADLPQVRLRLGRQLPHARRHALRVGGRAPRPAQPAPLRLLPERARGHAVRSRTDRRPVAPGPPTPPPSPTAATCSSPRPAWATPTPRAEREAEHGAGPGGQ